jgi:hypothetical protein
MSVGSILHSSQFRLLAFCVTAMRRLCDGCRSWSRVLLFARNTGNFIVCQKVLHDLVLCLELHTMVSRGLRVVSDPFLQCVLSSNAKSLMSYKAIGSNATS